MSQVVRALVYMHETAMICHRDLKVTRCSAGGGPRYVYLLVDASMALYFLRRAAAAYKTCGFLMRLADFGGKP